MFLAKRYGFSETFHNCPLIYPVLFKSEFAAAILICFHFVEKIVIGPFKGLSIEECIPSVGGGGMSGWIAVIMFVVSIPFFPFKDVSRVIGKDKMPELFFKPTDPAGRRFRSHEIRLK